MSQADGDMWLPYLLMTATLGSAVIPVSFVAPKWSQKYTKAYIQLSAPDLSEGLTEIPTENRTACGEV